MFKIMGVYKERTEEIDEHETEQGAEYLRGEYQMAFGPSWSIYIIEGA